MSHALLHIILMAFPLILFILVERTYITNDKFRKFFALDEKRPLYQTPIFWICVFAPLLLALWLALPLTEGLYFVRSREGYEYFANHFRFPIWISSGSLILGVVIGRFHASKQRASALVQTDSSNGFKNHIEHKKMFLEALNFQALEVSYRNETSDELPKTFKVYVFLDYEVLYKSLFPFNSVTNFDIRCTSLIGVPHIAVARDFAHGKGSLLPQKLLSKGENRELFSQRIDGFSKEYGLLFKERVNDPAPNYTGEVLYTSLFGDKDANTDVFVKAMFVEVMRSILKVCEPLANSNLLPYVKDIHYDSSKIEIKKITSVIHG